MDKSHILAAKLSTHPSSETSLVSCRLGPCLMVDVQPTPKVSGILNGSKSVDQGRNQADISSKALPCRVQLNHELHRQG